MLSSGTKKLKSNPLDLNTLLNEGSSKYPCGKVHVQNPSKHLRIYSQQYGKIKAEEKYRVNFDNRQDPYAEKPI